MDLESDEKPLILTEGKTDVDLLKTAWSKLYDIELPYEIVSVGIEETEGKRSGSADLVKRTLELTSNFSGKRIVVGLFDNDRAGFEQFKGLNKKVFADEDSGVRLHNTKKTCGIVLPAPVSRSLFITEGSTEQRYFEIEHYFSNQVLKQNNVKGESVLGTEVFGIKGNKTTFASKTNSLPKKEFSDFEILFDKLQEVVQNFTKD